MKLKATTFISIVFPTISEEANQAICFWDTNFREG
jgi:hypothetical protein